MKKYIKYIVLFVIIIVIFILGFFIYKNMFADSVNSRYKDIENYKLTNNEKNSVKDKINELENIKSVKVYKDSKIIKIVVKLEEDINFESIKTKANEAITSFSEENLSYYDLELFIESSNKESEVYPQIGYKFKTNSEFAW
ncbi:MAG: hypothetical protein IJE04_05710 [Bacilli bacterium]|nr:hypothetical protein [Bacilli bacterium]